VRGFKLPPETIESSNEIVISPLAKTESMDTKYKELPEITQPIIKKIGKSNCIISWNKKNMTVLLTSTLPSEASPNYFVESFFTECPYFTVEKTHIFWLIDDRNIFPEDYLRRLIERAQKMSKGLKYPFIFQYTPSSKVRPLLEFLLSIVTKQS
jgi:hypothetical protein